MKIVKTRITPVKNNNRFRVTVRWIDDGELHYHTAQLHNYSDEDLIQWIEDKPYGDDSKIDKIEWVDDEGIVYSVEVSENKA